MKNPSREPDIVWRRVGDELVIYHKQSRNVHILNRTAMEIWMLCDGKHNVENIAAALSGMYNTSGEELKADVASIIADFNRLRLIKN